VNILVVEDNPHMRRVLARMVRMAFAVATVLEAQDAAGALALCRESCPELVLMDVKLPDGNGIELTGRIRVMLPATPVVIVSTHRDRAYREAARAAGAADYVCKDDIGEKLLPALVLAIRPAPGPP
jgi:two-component system NtrC family response regulator